MMYNNKFVMVIKSKGKVLREYGEIVRIPFGSEYSIVLKNLNSVKAIAEVLVDGKAVSKRYSFILDPNDALELEGFIRGEKVSNKFKFIERTKRIENYRGIGLCDGLVQVTFQFEQEVYVWTQPPYYSNTIDFDNPYIPKRNTCDKNNDLLKTATFSCENNDVGITVKGSESDQVFTCSSAPILDNTKYNMILRLKGIHKQAELKKAITIKTKLKCETCGKKNRSDNKFCCECGTALF